LRFFKKRLDNRIKGQYYEKIKMAKKIAKKCAYVVGYQAVEWGEKIDNKKWIAI
jgi:hypothetical protein